MNTQQLSALQGACEFLLMQHSQLRVSQLALVLKVAQKEGQTQTELADQCGLTLSAISRALDVLGSSGRKDKISTARMGWLEARENKDDDRIKQVHLTQKGRVFVDFLLTTCFTA